MFKHIAALGIGLTTLIAAPLALAAPCDPAHPSAAHAPSAVRAPTPTRVALAPRRIDAQHVALRRADSNRDGRITYSEARAQARGQFDRADRDDNGALSSWEVRNASDDVTRLARGQGQLVTRAEFDAATRARFARLDTNRDGLLSRRELGLSATRTNPAQARRWSL